MNTNYFCRRHFCTSVFKHIKNTLVLPSFVCDLKYHKQIQRVFFYFKDAKTSKKNFLFTISLFNLVFKVFINISNKATANENSRIGNIL